MGLFNSLDIKDDFLSIRFDDTTKTYYACLYDGTVVDNLNIRSRRFLERKNKELLSNPELLAQEEKKAKILRRALKLKRLGFESKSFRTLYCPQNIEESMSSEMADYLRNLTSEEDVLIGIHRTGFATLDSIADILQNGLSIASLNGGTTSNNNIDLKNTVSYYDDNETIITELITAKEWNNSLGSILIRIPDEDLSGNIIYIDSETGENMLDPQYIIGFVPCGDNGYISEIISAYPPTDEKPFKGIEALYDDRVYAASQQESSNLK